MRKKVLYLFSMLICVLVGMGIMTVVVYFFPNEVVKTVTEKNVTVVDTGIAESVDKIKDSVVVIEAYVDGSLVSTGTGFVYQTDGEDAYIMTNHHVIEKQDDIKITYSDDSETYAKLVGSDAYADIAVLKVSKDTIKSVASLGNSETLRVGDTVFTLGSPMGIEYRGTVTRGILSGINRLVPVDDYIMNVMQTDAAINPGNSGGPLCNINGEVIGINSLKIVEDRVEGLGFAIPIEDALKYASDIRDKGSVSRPYIGVSMINATSTMQLVSAGIRLDRGITEGVVVVEVERDSPADKAGFLKEDVIVKVAGKKVVDVAQFRYELYMNDPGDEVELEVIRNGNTIKLEVTLGGN